MKLWDEWKRMDGDWKFDDDENSAPPTLPPPGGYNKHEIFRNPSSCEISSKAARLIGHLGKSPSKSETAARYVHRNTQERWGLVDRPLINPRCETIGDETTRKRIIQRRPPRGASAPKKADKNVADLLAPRAVRSRGSPGPMTARAHYTAPIPIIATRVLNYLSDIFRIAIANFRTSCYPRPSVSRFVGGAIVKCGGKTVLVLVAFKFAVFVRRFDRSVSFVFFFLNNNFFFQLYKRPLCE